MDTSKDQQSGAGKGQQISDGKDATKQATSGHIENFSSFANSIRPYGFQPKQEKKMNDEELYQFEKEKARKGEYLHASMQGSSQTFVKGKYRCKYHHSHDCPNGLNPGDICWSCHNAGRDGPYAISLREAQRMESAQRSAEQQNKAE